MPYKAIDGSASRDGGGAVAQVPLHGRCRGRECGANAAQPILVITGIESRQQHGKVRQLDRIALFPAYKIPAACQIYVYTFLTKGVAMRWLAAIQRASPADGQQRSRSKVKGGYGLRK